MLTNKTLHCGRTAGKAFPTGHPPPKWTLGMPLLTNLCNCHTKWTLGMPLLTNRCNWHVKWTLGMPLLTSLGSPTTFV